MSVLSIYRDAVARLAPDERRALPAPGQTWICDFASNDYLALSRSPAVVHAARRAVSRYGLGATGSRLLSGNHVLHEILERRIARDLGAPSVLLFPSGYQTNVALCTALLAEAGRYSACAVFTDRLIHASLHAGIQAAGAHEQRFRHNDMAHLEMLLRSSAPGAHRVIITESIFGMDGDCAPLRQLRTLARTHDALLIIDDAHGVGMLGPRGLGAFDEGVPSAVAPNEVCVGTLSKALGGGGAYVASSLDIRNFLLQRCGGFIFSTALAPALTAGALAAWRTLPQLQPAVQELMATADMFRRAVQNIGFSTAASTAHIVPVVFGDNARTLLARDRFAAHNIRVSAIRPPTVPPHQSRLRFAFTTMHTRRDAEAALAVLSALAPLK